MTDKETRESLVRRLYEAFNERALDEAVEMTHPEGSTTIVGTGEKFEGREGARRYNEMWLAAFPDGHATIDRVHLAGDYAVVEFTGHGTHTGTLSTEAGDIPATGKQVTMQFCDVIEFKDDMPYRQRSYFDSAAMMMQLGLLEAGAGAAAQQ